MLFRAMTGLVTVYHGTALAAGLRIKLGNQVSLWSAIKRLMDAGLQRSQSYLACSPMATLLLMQCQRLRFWLFVLSPIGLKIASQSL